MTKLAQIVAYRLSSLDQFLYTGAWACFRDRCPRPFGLWAAAAEKPVLDDW
jgi:hypothetical protein